MSVAELAAYNKPDREKMLYEGAKKEGKLMWYTSLTGGPNTDVPKVFESKYPGVQVEVYRGDSDALISRILQEAQRPFASRRVAASCRCSASPKCVCSIPISTSDHPPLLRGDNHVYLAH